MTQLLKWEQFNPLLNQKFSLNYHPDRSPLELELLEVADKRLFGGEYIGFHLIFGSGPKEVHLPQGNWEIEHPCFGKKSFFMVPAGPKDSYFTYCVSISYKKRFLK